MMMMTSHSGIYSLNKDVLHHILEFHGKKAYATLGLVNKEFHKLFDDDGDYDDDGGDETTNNTITKMKKKKTKTFIGFISPQIMTELKEDYLLLIGTSTMLRMSRAIIKYRNMGLLDWAIKQQGQEQQATCTTSYGSSLLRTICHDATQSKDGLFILKYVYDFDYCLDCTSLLGSPFVGQLQIKQKQEKEKRRSIMRNDKELSVYAAKYGHVSILTWLHENGFDISFERAMYCASSRGHLDALQFLHANNKNTHYQDPPNNKNNNALYSKLCTSTAMSKQLEVLKWLYNNNNNHSSTTPTPTPTAAADNDDDGEDNLGVDIISSDTAFFSEHLQVLEWLKSKGCAYIKKNCKQRAMDSDQMDDKERAEMVQWIEMNM